MTVSDVDLDFVLPAGTLLKLGTKKVHDEGILQSEGAGQLTRGELDREEYIRYLMMLWHIYSTLESGLDEHCNESTLSPTYNPALLSRASRLSADISYLLALPDDDASWKLHGIHKELVLSPPAALEDYTTRLATLRSQDPARLLAHSYVRYLGDLSGGQIMKWRLRKAYGLDEGDGNGVRFYEFPSLGDEGVRVKMGEVASAGEMKRIKEWFRRGIDQGVGDDRKLKEALLDETLKAYELNGGLLAILKLTSTRSLTKENTPEKPQAETGYSVASVIAFILAVGIAHFALVVGGYTGERGYAKFELAQEWLNEFFNVSRKGI